MSSQKQYTRTVTEQGPGTLGASLPAGFVDECEIEKGDELKIENLDWDNGMITFRV